MKADLNEEEFLQKAIKEEIELTETEKFLFEKWKHGYQVVMQNLESKKKLEEQFQKLNIETEQNKGRADGLAEVLYNLYCQRAYKDLPATNLEDMIVDE